MYVITYLSEPTEYTIQGVNPNVNYGLQMIKMSQCRYTICNKCTTLIWGNDKEAMNLYGQGAYGNSVPLF